MKYVRVRGEEGRECSTPQQQKERWQRHFSRILNIQSQFDEEEIKKAKQWSLRKNLEEPPQRKNSYLEVNIRESSRTVRNPSRNGEVCKLGRKREFPGTR